MSGAHWVQWHEAYDDAGSSLARRLVAVQRRLAQALDAALPGPVRLLSMCAGDGRDVTGVLGRHRRARDVVGRLVECDPILAGRARARASELSLEAIEVVEDDAGRSDAYAGVVPADVVLVCGVFGNVLAADVRSTVAELPHLCRTGASVIWTRHRHPPDLTPSIRRWFADCGFAEVGFDTESPFSFAVGTNVMVGEPRPFRPGRRLFDFIGDGSGAHR
jgi:hypothetical protein